jgi:hypothetical protein
MQWLSRTQSQSYYISTAAELTNTAKRQMFTYQMEYKSPQGHRYDGEMQSGG